MLGSKKTCLPAKLPPPGPVRMPPAQSGSPENGRCQEGRFWSDQVTSDWLGGGLKYIIYIYTYVYIYIYIHVLSSSLFGEDYHFDSYIFGMGWNHHLAAYSEKEKKIEANLTKKDSADSYFCMCQKWGRGLSRTFCKKKHATSCSTWQSLSPSWAPSTNLLIYPCVSSLTMKNNVGLVWFGLC